MDIKVTKLFQGKNLVFLATTMKDGSPQVSPVWADLQDNYIMVNTAEGRVKHKNILRDPRVAISVVDQDNPLVMTAIKGTVEKIIPDYDYHHANQLTKKYLGQNEYPFRRPNEKRIIFKIKPEKVFILPEFPASNK
jgi:PPOX class probable F420-dependent enzyme